MITKPICDVHVEKLLCDICGKEMGLCGTHLNYQGKAVGYEYRCCKSVHTRYKYPIVTYIDKK